MGSRRSSRRVTSLACLAAAATLLKSQPAHATLVLDQIILHNEQSNEALKTTVTAVQARMHLKQGDVIEYGILKEVADNLIASDLFTSVRVELPPDLLPQTAVQLMYLDQATYGVDVHVYVREK